jgi:Acetyltransferases
MTELRKITDENFDECIGLEPNKEQRGFVASNLRSLAEAYVALVNHECVPIPYAIYSDGVMVGFIMLSYNEVNKDNAESTYWVWRLMIDKHYQGRGYGKESMIKALNFIRTFPYGKSSAVFLSYEPENMVAKGLYASLGFVKTGKIEDGEIVANLIL